MTFETLILTFAGRFLSARSFELIVAPAVADLQFEESDRAVARLSSRLAVLSALAGGVRDDVARDIASFVMLMLMPAGYYIFMMILCFDFMEISISTGFFVFAALILALSFAPAMVCFWPERRAARSAD